MGSAETQGRFWGAAARDWAELQEPRHRPLWEAMLAAGGVERGTRVCDVGCGGGGASVLAAERGARVSGLDAAGNLVEVARRRLPEADLRVGDMESLPFPDDAFDVVLAANSLQFTADGSAALRETGRICRPGGRVVVAVWGPPEKVEFRVVLDAVRETLPDPPPGGPLDLSEPGVLAGLIGDAGLDVTDSGSVSCPFAYPGFTALWRAIAAAGPLQAALQQVPERQLAGAVESAAAPFRSEDGSLRFENLCQYVVATS